MGGPEKDQGGEGRAEGRGFRGKGEQKGQKRGSDGNAFMSKITCADDGCSACTFHPHVHKFVAGEKVQAGSQVKHTHTESQKLPLTRAQAAALRLRGYCCSRSFSPCSLPGRVLLASSGGEGTSSRNPAPAKQPPVRVLSGRALHSRTCPCASLVRWICAPEDKKCMQGSRHLSVPFFSREREKKKRV